MTGVLQMLVASRSTGGGALSATKSGDASAFGEAPPNTQSLTTNNVSITAIGGSGSYTYAWAFVSGNNVFAISDSGAATVNWTATVGLFLRSAVWRCTVNDGLTSVTVDVVVEAQVI